MSDADARREAARSLRAALAEYVRTVHGAYLDAARRAGVDPATLELAAAPFTVAVVAGAQLHVLATRDDLPAVLAHEQVISDAQPPLAWSVRFLDATVVPGLGAGDDDVFGAVGVSSVLYQLVVRPDASLDAHQAMHAGTGLANAHITAQRR